MSTPTLPPKPVRITKAIEKQRFGLLKRIEKAAKQDASLVELVDRVRALWCEAHTELEVRDFSQAESQDAGETCWTVFVPIARDRHVIAYVRTPHRAWMEIFYKWGHQVLNQRCAATDPWKHLAIVMGQARAEAEAAAVI